VAVASAIGAQVAVVVVAASATGVQAAAASAVLRRTPSRTKVAVAIDAAEVPPAEAGARALVVIARAGPVARKSAATRAAAEAAAASAPTATTSSGAD
jgi:hypothetical protein